VPLTKSSANSPTTTAKKLKTGPNSGKGVRRKVERLQTGDAATLYFAEYDDKGELTGGLAKRWLDYAGAPLKSSSGLRRAMAIKALAPFFKSKTIRAISESDLEQWVIVRSPQCKARTFNIERETLILILDYAVKHGLLLENPAREIRRRKQEKKAILIPDHEQFKALVAELRSGKGRHAADLVEFLAYSGMRIDEVTGLNGGGVGIVWSDINFNQKTFTIRGSDAGTKNHEARVVPLFPSLERLLLRLREIHPMQPTPNGAIFEIKDAKRAIATACHKLGYPRFGHHTFRHFFCSNAIELGVDFKAIAGWLGHKDGGLLVAKTYGHLRNTHSEAMAQKMTFDAGVCLREQVNNEQTLLSKS
jgi:integrase